MAAPGAGLSAALRIEPLAGAAIAAHLDTLAALRIAVFREWPYLYDGNRDYEARYLDVYPRAPRGLAVLAWNGADCIGATTSLPLTEAADDAQRPFREQGYPLSRIAYFGESVILPAYRGQGLGARFFDLREAHARAHGLSVCAFCAVRRPETHPARPPGHRGNEAFWRRRGYRPAPRLTAWFDWPDLDPTTAAPAAGDGSAKPMDFWLRELDPPP